MTLSLSIFRPARSVAVFASLALHIAAWGKPDSSPEYSPSGPDAELFGAAAHFPVGDRTTWQQAPYLVGSYSHFDTIFPTNRIARGDTVRPFARDGQLPEITYEFQGQRRTLADYFARFPVTGFLVLQGDTILFERYQYGRTERDRFQSQSMAKSVAAFLVGIAHAEGKIRSLDDRVEAYVPALKGTLYGETRLRTLLQMGSGIAFDEKDGPERADSSRLFRGQFEPDADPVAVLAACTRRIAAEGTRFHYSAGDSEALGLVLRAVTGRTVSEYLSEKLWQPLGMESEASWACDTSKQEYPFYGLNATLRDYARLGWLLAHDGQVDGRQLISREFLREATSVRVTDKHLQPGAATPYYGYGYQTWVFPGNRPMFVLRGALSQYVFVDPTSKLVLAQTAVRSEGPDSENGRSECLAVWQALVTALGRGSK